MSISYPAKNRNTLSNGGKVVCYLATVILKPCDFGNEVICGSKELLEGAVVRFLGGGSNGEVLLLSLYRLQYEFGLCCDERREMRGDGRRGRGEGRERGKGGE